jgi:hypothetical protein
MFFRSIFFFCCCDDLEAGKRFLWNPSDEKIHAQEFHQRLKYDDNHGGFQFWRQCEGNGEYDKGVSLAKAGGQHAALTRWQLEEPCQYF